MRIDKNCIYMCNTYITKMAAINGYEMMADSYRQVLDRDREKMDPIVVECLGYKIRVFCHLAELK